jgi:hypothetical protein
MGRSPRLTQNSGDIDRVLTSEVPVSFPGNHKWTSSVREVASSVAGTPYWS